VGFTIAGNGTAGRIVGHQFLGEVDLLSVAIDGSDRPVRVRTRDNSAPFTVGSSVWLTVDPRDVLVFAKETE
jgi:iron(III) transport system ATP-binding protein